MAFFTVSLSLEELEHTPQSFKIMHNATLLVPYSQSLFMSRKLLLVLSPSSYFWCCFLFSISLHVLKVAPYSQSFFMAQSFFILLVLLLILNLPSCLESCSLFSILLHGLIARPPPLLL